MAGVAPKTAGSPALHPADSMETPAVTPAPESTAEQPLPPPPPAADEAQGAVMSVQAKLPAELEGDLYPREETGGQLMGDNLQNYTPHSVPGLAHDAAVPLPPPNETSADVISSPQALFEALPQSQAPPVAPPTFESEEIIITANDATAIITTTTAAPTMTSAISVAPLVASVPTAVSVSAASLPSQHIVTVLPATTSPTVLHQVRSSSSGGTPTSGSGPKHSKSSAKAAAPSEKPAEAVIAENRPSAKKPLTLLELPADILRLIVKEITHTNDLTAMALANSTLYSLAIPHIYSRFDIVWPDPDAPASEGKSVDALTYGLSTLCLGSAFARTTHRLHNDLRRRGLGSPEDRSAFRRPTKFGTADYAKYTRKFSLGNGPPDWVAEYMINKESGKMLGTLVALCVAKMKNLENFVWDMPTGVVSDVFMALASLPDYDPEHDECKLDRVWIRWHNNSLATPPGTPSTSPSLSTAQQQTFLPQGSNLTPIGIMLPPHSSHPQPRAAIPYSSSHVEFPTFSVLPPLRSLTVLDIDEIAYLDEMAVLIERSQSRLTELRVGIAAHATNKDFVQTWDGGDLQQVDLHAYWPGESSIGDRRLGGILGVLVGRIYDIRRRPPASKLPFTNGNAAVPTTSGTPSSPAPANQANEASGDAQTQAPAPAANPVDSAASASLETEPTAIVAAPEPAIDRTTETPALNGDAAAVVPDMDHHVSSTSETPDDTDVAVTSSTQRLDKKLRLTTLELERVPLSMQVLVRAIDWTTVTTLTILSCPQHESLWRQLRKHFKPTAAVDHMYGGIVPTTSASGSASAPLSYHLALKNIHTDIVSKALLTFIKEALAPNTLEVLFLQSRRRADASPQITVQDIFKNAIKPHRVSLRKLLIDGSLRTNSDILEPTRRRRPWVLTTEILSFLTSGRMSNLRELAISLHYRDWHTFLQRLPNLTQLRSLHIQHIAEHIIAQISPYDLAMQIADIVTLRPEVQLCFVGIESKCYEVVEFYGFDNANGNSNSADGFGPGGTNGSVDGSVAGGTDTSSSEDDDDDDDDDDADDDDDDSDDGDSHHGANGTQGVNGAGLSAANNNTASGAANFHNDSDDSDSGESDDDSLDGGDDATSSALPRQPRLRMREIFFYDDKVAIFKARHGRL